MTDKTKVYRVVFNDGENHNAICFREPVQGLAFEADQLFALPGASACPVNDDGLIPHQEPSGAPNENLGITWHFAK